MTDLTELHAVVLYRAKHHCEVCRKDYSAACNFLPDGRNAYLCAHHIKSQKAYPKLALDPDNCICVCLQCHRDLHNGVIPNERKPLY